MNINTPEAQELLAALRSTPVGAEVQGLNLGSLLRSFETDATVVLIETTESKYWELRAYWLGIPVANLVAEVRGKELLVEAI